MDEFYLEQLVTIPTRGHNILDLVLTNNRDEISHISVIPTVINSDHLMVVTHLRATLSVSQSPHPVSDIYSSIIQKYDLGKATEEDWAKYRAILNASLWEQAAKSCSCFQLSDKVQLLTESIEHAVAQVFPLKKG